ncbi:thioesterase II family protein [Streptomyces sp. SM1]|uniref:thioesterase II family protein n=2 Tax=unclassified Streptomyces TaxID=2593676 RepID=UPI000CD4D2BC|nr:alpha/beta fold hydrolase [Streptomyces sp. SM1]
MRSCREMPRRRDARCGRNWSRHSPCSTPSDLRRSFWKRVAMLDTEPWMRRFPAAVSPTTPWTVLFFPHSGGSAGSYQELAARVADLARTACVQYPGRAERGREPLFTDVHVLADQVAGALIRRGEAGPMIFFGHSLGAAVAYEVVRRMPDQRRIVLVASGHPAPSRLKLPALDCVSDVRDDSEDRDKPLIELIKSLGGPDAGLLDHPLLRRMFLPVIRGDLMAHSRYRPEADSAVDCPVIALMGTADPLTSTQDVRAWERHTSSGLRVHVLPGGHFFTQQHTGDVADILRRVMTAHAGSSRQGPAR